MAAGAEYTTLDNLELGTLVALEAKRGVVVHVDFQCRGGTLSALTEAVATPPDEEFDMPAVIAELDVAIAAYAGGASPGEPEPTPQVAWLASLGIV